MFGKIVDNKLVIAGQKIKIENGWITNPTEKQLKDNGYKEVVRTERQNYDSETEKLVEVYKDNGKAIEISYEKTKLTDEEHNAIIQQEIEDEENKITQRNLRNAIKGDSYALNKIDEIENNIASLRAKIKGA